MVQKFLNPQVRAMTRIYFNISIYLLPSKVGLIFVKILLNFLQKLYFYLLFLLSIIILENRFCQLV